MADGISGNPVQTWLAAPVTVTLPRDVWINMLSVSHVDYPDPRLIPWVSEMVTAIEAAVDTP